MSSNRHVKSFAQNIDNRQQPCSGIHPEQGCFSFVDLHKKVIQQIVETQLVQ